MDARRSAGLQLPRRDLLALGKIPDPFIGQNEEKSKWVAERDWEYRRAFFVDQAMLQMDEVFLHCEMLDTLCEVFVNGILAGRGKNMHLRYDFSVKQYLREGENEVRIVFFSPLQFLREEEKREHVPGCPQSVPGVPHIRKAHCHFGWDWGPTIPISGITRDISCTAIKRPVCGNAKSARTITTAWWI